MNKPHRQLIAWQKAMDLVTRIYRMTESFPQAEQYGLTSQMRRAAVSIPSNLAEGAARKSLKEFSRFLHMARGSLSELDTQIELASRIGYLPGDDKEALDLAMRDVDCLINGLIRKQVSKQQ